MQNPDLTGFEAKPSENLSLSSDAIWIRLEDGSSRMIHLQGDCLYLSPSATSDLENCIIKKSNENSSVNIVKKLASYRMLDINSKRFFTLNKTIKYFKIQFIYYVVYIMGLCNFVTSINFKIKMLLMLSFIFYQVFGISITIEAWQKYFGKFIESKSKINKCYTVVDLSNLVINCVSNSVFPLACKERALVTFALCQQYGYNVSLFLGVQLFPFSGHCWVQHDDIILSDEPERCKIFMPVRSYDNRKINFYYENGVI
ncbi:MAG: lasso peptide biosynthesis B2 protein [Dolichospermum sp.]